MNVFTDSLTTLSNSGGQLLGQSLTSIPTLFSSVSGTVSGALGDSLAQAFLMPITALSNGLQSFGNFAPQTAAPAAAATGGVLSTLMNGDFVQFLLFGPFASLF